MRRKNTATNAVALVAVEAARDVAAGPWAKSLKVALRFEAMLRGLVAQLTRSGQDNAAAHVSNVIVETRRAAAVPHDVETGRKLLERLTHDARATL